MNDMVQQFHAMLFRALYKVFQFTEKLVQRILLRAEDAILEVS